MGQEIIIANEIPVELYEGYQGNTAKLLLEKPLLCVFEMCFAHLGEHITGELYNLPE